MSLARTLDIWFWNTAETIANHIKMKFDQTMLVSWNDTRFDKIVFFIRARADGRYEHVSLCLSKDSSLNFFTYVMNDELNKILEKDFDKITENHPDIVKIYQPIKNITRKSSHLYIC